MTRTETPFPYTTPFRSLDREAHRDARADGATELHRQRGRAVADPRDADAVPAGREPLERVTSSAVRHRRAPGGNERLSSVTRERRGDRKSTRLNSSH